MKLVELWLKACFNFLNTPITLCGFKISLYALLVFSVFGTFLLWLFYKFFD